MKQKIVYFFLIAMALGFVYLRFSQIFQDHQQETPLVNVPKIMVGNVEVIVEIADTSEKQHQGLSGREPLSDRQGMFFPMGSAARHNFWMKDMKFPLDIIWIRNNKIIDISDNVSAPAGDEMPITVRPKEPADAVLEVNADFTEKYGVIIGDRAQEIDKVQTP